MRGTTPPVGMHISILRSYVATAPRFDVFRSHGYGCNSVCVTLKCVWHGVDRLDRSCVRRFWSASAMTSLYDRLDAASQQKAQSVKELFPEPGFDLETLIFGQLCAALQLEIDLVRGQFARARVSISRRIHSQRPCCACRSAGTLFGDWSRSSSAGLAADLNCRSRPILE